MKAAHRARNACDMRLRCERMGERKKSAPHRDRMM